MLARQIPPDHEQFVDDLLKSNAACLDALDRGLERGQLQFPPFQSLEQVPADTDFIYRLSDVARLHMLRFRRWFAEGDLVPASEELFRLETIGSMICTGEGQMIHYLVGLWLRAVAVRGFGHMAAKMQTPAIVLERILETLDTRLKSADGLIQSLRVDLSTLALARLERTVEGPDLDAVVNKLLEVYYVPQSDRLAAAGDSEHAIIDRGWLEERRRQILLLLAAHPRPLDKAATARLMGATVAETIGDLAYSRRPAVLDVLGQLHGMRRKLRLNRLAKKTRFWPVGLTPDASLDTNGFGARNLPQLESITTVATADEKLTDDCLAALNARLRGIDNPIGLMLTEHLMARDYSPRLLDHLHMMRTMRGLLKQRLAEEGKVKS